MKTVVKAIDLWQAKADKMDAIQKELNQLAKQEKAAKKDGVEKQETAESVDVVETVETVEAIENVETVSEGKENGDGN